MRACSTLFVALLVAGFGCGEQVRSSGGLDGAVAFDQRQRPISDRSRPDTDAGPDAAAVAGASCSFRAPSCSTCTNPVTFALDVTGPIARVRYRADGLHDIGVGLDATSGFAVSATFQQSGQHTITAHGLSSAGQELATCARKITVAPGWPDVPYFYQYDNTRYPGSSCQNTSVAMVLAYYGWKGKPDDITSTWGHKQAQSPAGLAQVFNDYAAKLGIPQRITPHTSGTVQQLRSLLAKGKPVIIHGYFTGYGHVVVTLAFTGTHYVVNDPAGKWSEVFKGGYGGRTSSPTAGKAVKYGAVAFEKAVATSDGSSLLPLWFHEIKP